MRFTIEVLSGASVVRYATHESIGPKSAKTKAMMLCKPMQKGGADAVRILNAEGDEIFRWDPIRRSWE
jgi:hypothetical protein